MLAASSRFDTDRREYAFHTALLSFALAGVGAFLFVSEPQPVALTADTTIQRFVVLTSYLSMVNALTGYRLLTDEQDKISRIEKLAQRQFRKDWIGRVIVSFAVAWILSTACQAVFGLLISKVLVGTELPRIVMMLLFAVYGAALGFGVAFFIVGVDDVEINWLIIILGVGAILLSMTLVANQNWWQRSVSALGIDSGSGTFFNITVIVIGLVALTLGRDLIADLKLLTEVRSFPSSGFNIIRFGLTGIGLGIVGVGLFPTEGLPFSHEMHLLSAHVMAVLCILGMLLISVITPNIFPTNFVYFSGVLGIICILAIVAHFAQRLQFVAMELMLFGLFGVWVFFFRFQTKHYVRQQLIREIRRELAESLLPGHQAASNKWFLKYPELVREAIGNSEGITLEQ
jgi:hypothetical protein